MNNQQIFRVNSPTAIQPWGFTIGFGIRSDNRITVALPVKMKILEEGFFNEEGPMLTNVNDQAMQSLMDQLWNVGIRPSDIGTPGHLAATQAHLSDMQKLVAKAYSVEL